MLLETPKANIGSQIIPFNLADTEGKWHSLNDLQGKNGTVIAFICNHCPYVKAIIARLVTDAQYLKTQGINTVAINSNDYLAYPEDSPANMKTFAQQHGMDFAYLIDADQTIGQAYDAVCTPDFFGYDAQGTLQYRGRLDDAKMNDASQRNAELVNGMLQIIQTGQGPKEQHPSVGCSIKWKS